MPNIEDVLPDDWNTWSDPKKREFLNAIKYDWSLWRRPEQWPPDSEEWSTFVYLAGRGAGKTRSGAEWVRDYAKRHPGCRIAIIGPTLGSVRDVCIEGDSGLRSVTPDSEFEGYNKTLSQFRFKNGSIAFGYSAEMPERLRGPQHHIGWYDELASWREAQATWDMAAMGMRLGKRPQIFISTTPKPVPIILSLVARAEKQPEKVILRSGSTFANAANLAPAALEELRERYEGTALGRQELYAELIFDAAGALWRREWIESNRTLLPIEHIDIVRRVVAVDPSAGYHPDNGSEESAKSTQPVTGIIVAGIDARGHAYVLDDRSVPNPTPDQWATEAVRAFHDWQCDKIIYERNHGGAMAEHTLRTVWENAPLKHVYATHGKYVRAEPVAALYEQNKVHHNGTFKFLEDQMVMWEDGMRWSPDRMDALVWAMWELMLGGGSGDMILPTVSDLGWLA